MRSFFRAPKRYVGPMAALLLAAACGSADDTQLTSDGSVDSSERSAEHASLAAAKSGVAIRSGAASTMCLAVDGGEKKNGAHVVIEPCVANDASQAWILSGGEVKIFGDMCLDVTSGRDQDGTKLQIWQCDAKNKNQLWSWRGTTLQWTNHNRCLDLTDGSQVGGTMMQVWRCIDGSVNQTWRMAAVSSTAGSASNNGATSSLDDGSKAQSLPRLKVSGNKLVDSAGKAVVLKGTNIGGWLVTENWMCGITDKSDGTGRFARETLEKRFGETATDKLLNLWYDTWLTEDDFEKMKDVGFNVARLPFGWRNLQHADGSWRKDSSGNIDFSRLDWAIAQAAARGIYTILDFHIWDSQQTNYQRISGQSSEGAADQSRAAKIWTEVAKRYAQNHSVVAYDIINEPTGSAGNKMQNALYRAVRSQDAQKPIIMESVSANPSGMGWSNTIYSFHEYNMMGTNYSQNKSAFGKDDGTLNQWKGWPVPVYIGEFMAQGDNQTLSYMIKAFNARGYSWTSWTWKTVNMGSWGLYNFHPSSSALDVLHDSVDTLTKKIKGLGKATEQQPTLKVFKESINAE